MCADAAGEVVSVMGNRDMGAREVRGCRERERDRRQKIRVHYILGLIREMKAVN